jgi:hypothetical protein
VTFNWKIPAIAAGGAFLLSFLIGLAGQVGFGIVMLRALLWAVIFAALSFGADLLLRRFLPELFSGESNDEDADERSVDIILEEENPVDTGNPEDAGEFEEAEDKIEEAEMVSEAENEEGDEFQGVDEPEELKADADDSPGSPDNSDTASESEFSDFESVETAFAVSDEVEPEIEKPAANIDVLGIDEDPATVARAVRTFMKKDQEG